MMMVMCWRHRCRVLPPRVNEVIGVQHIKAYVFDDDVIMSGANLSNDYFTKRQASLLFSGASFLVKHRNLVQPSRRSV